MRKLKLVLANATGVENHDSREVHERMHQICFFHRTYYDRANLDPNQHENEISKMVTSQAMIDTLNDS